MMNCRASEGDRHQVFLRILGALADGVGNLARLSQADPHMAVLVPYHDEGTEVETLGALSHLRHPVDPDRPFRRQIDRVGVDPSVEIFQAGRFLRWRRLDLAQLALDLALALSLAFRPRHPRP